MNNDFQELVGNIDDDNGTDRHGFQSRHRMICYSPDIAFQVHLMSVMQDIHGVPLNMFEKL
jgi:hypothetical protein